MNTLRWWARFWRLAWKVAVMRDPAEAQRQQIRAQIEELQATKPH